MECIWIIKIIHAGNSVLDKSNLQVLAFLNAENIFSTESGLQQLWDAPKTLTSQLLKL